jgi:hypothetical protein
MTSLAEGERGRGGVGCCWKRVSSGPQQGCSSGTLKATARARTPPCYVRTRLCSACRSECCAQRPPARSPLATLPLTLAGAHGLEAGLVAQRVLAGLHHQRQTAVDVLLALLLRVGRGRRPRAQQPRGGSGGRRSGARAPAPQQASRASPLPGVPRSSALTPRPTGESGARGGAPASCWTRRPPSCRVCASFAACEAKERKHRGCRVRGLLRGAGGRLPPPAAD